jgi:hypothetical protein
MDRRSVLKLVQAGMLTAAAWPLVRERRARADASPRPRFYLQIIPQGGFDAIYTTDPKKRNEVGKDIDVPFGANDIVEAGNVRLGPGFKRLARWVPRMSIVNAFRQNSANHLSGLAHVVRCKSSAPASTLSLLEILGARRKDEAVGAVHIGTVTTSAFSPAFLGEPSKVIFGDRPGLFAHLDKAKPDALVAASKALQREAQQLSGARASTEEQVTAENLRSAAELFSRAAASPKFSPIEWPHSQEGYYQASQDLQRALWLFENKLSRCVTVCVGYQDFDTHLWNTTIQPLLTDYLASLLDRLFTELDGRTVDGMKLSQQTVVFVGSEIGRFPRLNVSHGKDHFPQVPHLFFGPGLATGASFGATDREMVTRAVSLKTGRPDRAGHQLRVDDIGTTLLALDGANPELYGYTGSHLDFLRGG